MKNELFFANGNHLAEILKEYRAHSQFTLVTCTEPKTLKKSRSDKNVLFEDLFAGKIFKTSKRFASIGYEYEKSVNNRLTKEDKENDFISEPLPWGEWWDGSQVVIKHKDKFYIRITYLNANGKHGTDTYHYQNGEEITGELLDTLINDFLPAKSENKSQGLDNQIIVNSICADNIVEMAIDGMKLINESFVVNA